MTDKALILSACASEEEAARLARMLVEKHLAACVNILPPMRSLYRWNGELVESREWLLLIKTTNARFPEVRDALRQAHSYELPEILSLPVLDGLAGYLDWLEQK